MKLINLFFASLNFSPFNYNFFFVFSFEAKKYLGVGHGGKLGAQVCCGIQQAPPPPPIQAKAGGTSRTQINRIAILSNDQFKRFRAILSKIYPGLCRIVFEHAL